LPHQVTFSPDEATNARETIALIPGLYTYPPDDHARPLSGATVQYLNAEAPRISCEVHLPPHLFGLPSFTEGTRLNMNVVVISHYRGQEMFWGQGTAAKTFSRPEGWRPVRLG
jgi:hypothetical protein